MGLMQLSVLSGRHAGVALKHGVHVLRMGESRHRCDDRQFVIGIDQYLRHALEADAIDFGLKGPADPFRKPPFQRAA